MTTLLYGGTETHIEKEPKPSAIPRRSPSRPRLPKDQLNTDLNESPMPRAPDRSNSDKTIDSVPDSAVADLRSNQEVVPSIDRDSARHPSDATQISVADSAVDVKTLAESGNNNLLPSNAVVEKTMKALGKRAVDVLPQASLNDATAVAKSAFIEHLSRPSSVDSIIHHEGLSRASSHRSRVGPLPPMLNRTVRRVNTGTYLRLDTSTSAITGGLSSSSPKKERSPYVNTWNERLGRREMVIDYRPSAVHEMWRHEEGQEVNTAANFEYAGFGVGEIPQDPISGAWLVHQCSYRPHRAASNPPGAEGEKGEKKIKNPLKRFCAWIGSFEEHWEARRARKRVAKEEKLAMKHWAKMAKNDAKRATEEKKSAEQQRRRDSIARAMDAKAKVKRDFEAHKERQRLIEIKARENAAKQKKEMAEGEKAAKLAFMERKRQDVLDKREEKLRAKNERKKSEKRLRREMGTQCTICSHINNAMERYSGNSSVSAEEDEKGRLLREGVLEKQYEAARLKFEREEMERVRQRTRDIDPSRQELTWWEMKGLSAPPTGSATAAANAASTEDSDSDSHYAEDTDDIEDAVRRVGEVSDAMANIRQ